MQELKKELNIKSPSEEFLKHMNVSNKMLIDLDSKYVNTFINSVNHPDQLDSIAYSLKAMEAEKKKNPNFHFCSEDCCNGSVDSKHSLLSEGELGHMKTGGTDDGL